MSTEVSTRFIVSSAFKGENEVILVHAEITGASTNEHVRKILHGLVDVHFVDGACHESFSEITAESKARALGT